MFLAASSVVTSLVLCGPGSAQKPGLGPGLEGSGPRKHLSRALSPQAGPARAGLGLGPGFVGAVGNRNECFKNNLNAYRRVAKPSRNIPTGAQNGRPSLVWIFCPRAAQNDLWSTALCGVLRPGLEGLQGRALSSSRALSPLKPPPRARLGRATRSRALQAFGLQARPAQHYIHYLVPSALR